MEYGFSRLGQFETRSMIIDVPSVALTSWTTARAARLDHLAWVHRSAGIIDLGGPAVRKVLVRSLVLALASEFQGFARELHDEAAEFLASTIAGGNQGQFEVIRNNLVIGRGVDRVNAKPETLRVDFARLGVANLWNDIARAVPSGHRWRQQLERLNEARNAIAHDEENKLQLLATQGFPITIATMHSWRAACNGVSRHIDTILENHIAQLTGVRPW